MFDFTTLAFTTESRWRKPDIFQQWTLTTDVTFFKRIWPIFNKAYYVKLLMEDEPLNKSLHKPRLAILLKIGFVPETLESSEQLPKAPTRFVIEDS